MQEIEKGSGKRLIYVVSGETVKNKKEKKNAKNFKEKRNLVQRWLCWLTVTGIRTFSAVKRSIKPIKKN